VTTPVVPLLQASEFEVQPAYLKDAQLFRYTTNAPAAQWSDAAFNDTNWTSAPAGIGNTNDAGARIRTNLAFSEIWARTLHARREAERAALVRMMHDEDTQVFVNGVLAVDSYAYVSQYGDYMGSDAAPARSCRQEQYRVHTINIDGGRYVDVGLWMTDDAPAYVPTTCPSRPRPGSTIPTTTDVHVAAGRSHRDAPRQIGTATAVGTYAPALAADTTRALHLHGYVEVTEDGIYTFFVDPTTARVSRSARRESPRPAATTARTSQAAATSHFPRQARKSPSTTLPTTTWAPTTSAWPGPAPDFHSNHSRRQFVALVFGARPRKRRPLAPSHT